MGCGLVLEAKSANPGRGAQAAILDGAGGPAILNARDPADKRNDGRLSWPPERG